MKLYATITNSKGKTEGLGDNESLAVDLICKNKKYYSVYIEWCNVGDLEEPTMDALVTVREWRNEPDEKRLPKGVKQKGKDIMPFCKKCGGWTTQNCEKNHQNYIDWV